MPVDLPVTSISQQVTDMYVWRERRAWRQAAEFLNERGLAACVPCELVAWLRRRGLIVWCNGGGRVA